MLALISPAKKLDFETEPTSGTYSEPMFLKDTEELVSKAKNLSREDLMRLMGISEKLADLNFQRFQDFSTPFDLGNAKQAALVFNGDTYVGLKARDFDDADMAFAQDHLRILSGLYGMLRPLDLIQPYRLEMGIKLANGRGNNLYEFWDGQISDAIDDAVSSHADGSVINLASNEYFKAVKTDGLSAPVITPVFKEVRDGVAKVLGMMAKRARGTMARYMIQNRIERADDLKSFTEDGYEYRADLSDATTWVFTRER